MAFLPLLASIRVPCLHTPSLPPSHLYKYSVRLFFCLIQEAVFAPMLSSLIQFLSLKQKLCICSYCLGPAGRQGWALQTPRGDQWNAPTLELRREECFGVEGWRGWWAKIRAEVSSSRISQLKFEVTYSCHQSGSFPCPISCRCSPCNPPCQLLLLCQAEALVGG